MIWAEHLVWGALCRRHGYKIKRKIENRKIHPCVFLVALPQNSQHILQVIPSLCLLQKQYPWEDLVIVGMGATRREALQIVADLVDETFRNNGDFDVSSYLEQKERGMNE